MNLSERINAFVKLGDEFVFILEGNAKTKTGRRLQSLLSELVHRNGWYTEKNVRHRLEVLSKGLKKEILEQWLSAYVISEKIIPKSIGVILAGNIPLVGFDDLRCVLISGNIFCGKIPSDDRMLMPMLGELLIELEPRFAGKIIFEENQLRGMDAIIATGTSNSSRYFEHYFGKYPHIIRGNKNGVAVLTGNETKEELMALGDDVFRYFGLGCRNVTKLFVPENYNFNSFFEAIYGWGEEMLRHHKYMNNYEYHKTLYLLSRIPLLDNNFLLLKEDEGISSPPGVVFYSNYASLDKLSKKMEKERDKIQCIIAKEGILPNTISFGNSQWVGPSDYADGVDVLKFLINLS